MQNQGLDLLSIAFNSNPGPPTARSDAVPDDLFLEGIREQAKCLGMDPDKDRHLLWIAKKSLLAPLPHGWVQLKDANNNLYYYNEETGESQWEHPMDAHFIQLYQQKKQEEYAKYMEPSPSSYSGVTESEVFGLLPPPPQQALSPQRAYSEQVGTGQVAQLRQSVIQLQQQREEDDWQNQLSISELNSRVKTLGAENERLKRRIRRAEAEKGASDRALEDLQAELEEESVKAEELAVENSQLKTKMRNQERKLTTLENSGIYSSDRQEDEELEAALKETSELCDTHLHARKKAEKKISQLQKQIKRQEKALAELQVETERVDSWEDLLHRLDGYFVKIKSYVSDGDGTAQEAASHVQALGSDVTKVLQEHGVGITVSAKNASSNQETEEIPEIRFGEDIPEVQIEEKENLEQNLLKLKGEVAEWTEKCQAAEARIKEHEEQNNELQERLSEATCSLQARNKENEDLKASLEQEKGTRASLEEEIEVMEQEFTSSVSMKKKVEERHQMQQSQRENQNSELSQRMNEEIEKRKNAEGRCRQLEADLEKLSHEQEQLNNRLLELQAEVDEYMESDGAHTPPPDALDYSSSGKNNLHNEIERRKEAESRLLEMDVEKATWEVEKETLAEQIQKLEQAIYYGKVMIPQNTPADSEICERLSSLATFVEGGQNDQEQLESQVNDLQSQLREMTSMKQQLEQDLFESRRSGEKLEELKVSLTARLDATNTALETEQRQRDEERHALEQQIGKAGTEVSTWLAKEQLLKAEVARLESNLEKERSRWEEEQIMHTSNTKHVEDAFQKERDDWIAEKEQLIDERRGLLKEREDWRSDRERLEASLASSQPALEKERSHWAQTRQQYESDAETLRSRILEAKAKHQEAISKAEENAAKKLADERARWSEKLETAEDTTEMIRAEKDQLSIQSTQARRKLEDDLRSMERKLDRVVAEKEKQTEVWKMEKKELEKACQSADKALERERGLWEMQRKDLNKVIQSAERRVQNMEEQLKQCESKNKQEVAKSREKEQEMWKSLQEMTTKMAGMKTETGEENARKINEIQGKLVDQMGKERETEIELERALIEKKSQAQELATLKSKLMKSKLKRAALVEIKSKLDKELWEAKEEAKRHQLALEEFKQQASQSDFDLKDLKNQLQAAKMETEQLESARQEAEKEVDALRSRLERRKTKMAALIEEKEKLEKVSKELFDELQAAVKSSDSLRKKNKELSSKADEDMPSAEQEKKIQENEAELASLRRQLKNTEAELRSQRQLTEGFDGQFEDALNQARECKEKMREYEQRTQKEIALRKKMQERVLELQGNIRVLCRLRPMSEQEVSDVRKSDDMEEIQIEYPDDDTLLFKESLFEFDRVFKPGESQFEVFKEVQIAIASCLTGYKVCIFAYGQTGSGKTYTMEGPHGDRGVNFRALGELFRIAASQRDEITYSFKVSMLEVYNEKVKDLMVPPDSSQSQGLDIRLDKKHGVYVEGLVEVEVNNLPEVEELMALGGQHRTVGNNNVNLHSSRSHLVLQVKVNGTNKKTGTKIYGKLNLIDLAGSERIKSTSASGQRLKEAQNINKSLSALGDVIAALGESNNRHVPYRNSKLTHLLQDSLNSSAKVLMFVNINPYPPSAGESICSLNFASRCRSVQLGQAKRNVSVKRK